MSDKIFLTVVIPAYDEETNIKSTLKEVSGYLSKKAYPYEVIVVDDGSADKTFELAKDCSPLFANYRVIKNNGNQGKGFSVRRAVLESKGECVLFMDADNSTSIYELDKFLPYIKEGYDVIIASRRLKDSVVKEPQPLIRAMMGQFYILLSKIILRLNVRDLNCGFKFYNMRTSKFIFDKQTMNDWSFDSELLFLIKKYHLNVKEVPVRWVHKSGSKVRPFKDAVRSFISIVKIRFNDMKRLYELK